MTTSPTDAYADAHVGAVAPPATALRLDELVARAEALIRRTSSAGIRSVLGITGAPGVGKSTLAADLADALGGDAALVGMDGFHLADDQLTRLGRLERKGAPDTFDVDGYVALLDRLRSASRGIVYAPRFDRDLEQSIGSAIPIPPEATLIVTEGNYLTYDRGGWDAVLGRLDEVWHVDLDDDERRARLVARRQYHGDSATDAAAWVRDVDEANARLVASARHRAHLTVRVRNERTPS